MSQDMRDMMERVRKGQGWAEDDLMIVMHIKQKDRLKVEKLLYDMGLTENDAVEIVPTED